MVTIADAINVVIQKRSSSVSDGAGCCCQFYKITDKWGVKLYRDSERRLDCFSRQEQAALYSLAPNVGSPFSLEFEDNIYYGFTTEICPYVGFHVAHNKLFTPRHPKTQFDEISIGCECAYCAFDDRVKSQVDDLRLALEQIDLSFIDNHYGNWGWMDKPYGQHMVAIDFSEDGED